MWTASVILIKRMHATSSHVRTFALFCRFEDSRGWCCAAFNEVSIDYNAAFTGALARLVGLLRQYEALLRLHPGSGLDPSQCHFGGPPMLPSNVLTQ